MGCSLSVADADTSTTGRGGDDIVYNFANPLFARSADLQEKTPQGQKPSKGTAPRGPHDASNDNSSIGSGLKQLVDGVLSSTSTPDSSTLVRSWLSSIPDSLPSVPSYDEVDHHAHAFPRRGAKNVLASTQSALTRTIPQETTAHPAGGTVPC